MSSTFSKIARKEIERSEKPSNREDASRNRAGGVAFDINDPSTKLITMTAGSFFAEPKFYSNDNASLNCFDSKTKNREMRLLLASQKAVDFANCKELDDVAKEIIATVWDICESDNPRDALSIANWLRNEMNIRLTPQIILTLCSRHPATQKYVREYAPKIIVRPDEVKSVLLAHRYFFGHKTIKNCLNMGLGDAISKFSEKALIKYDDSNFPKWKDILRWVKRKQGWPLSKDLARYFTHGEVSKEGTPIAYKRKRLVQKNDFDSEAAKLAKESFANWEVLSSQFGTSKEGKKKIWTFAIENNMLGYMALLRNLRNIIEANVDLKTIEKACAKISDREEVLRSKQLPFRFKSAYDVIYNLAAVSSYKKSIPQNAILEAIDIACDISAENIDILPGVTAIFADNSGSMEQPVSAKSSVKCSDAANVLCGIVAKRAEHACVCAFGTEIAPVLFSKRSTVLEIAKAVRDANTRGMATNAYKCIEWLKENKIVPDRIIILSDMQCYNSNLNSYFYSYNEKSLADIWGDYRKKDGKNTFMHSVHLNGYGDDPFSPDDKRLNLTSGFSEKIFKTFLNAEGIIKEDGTKSFAVPTIDQIRADW